MLYILYSSHSHMQNLEVLDIFIFSAKKKEHNVSLIKGNLFQKTLIICKCQSLIGGN